MACNRDYYDAFMHSTIEGTPFSLDAGASGSENTPTSAAHGSRVRDADDDDASSTTSTQTSKSSEDDGDLRAAAGASTTVDTTVAGRTRPRGSLSPRRAAYDKDAGEGGAEDAATGSDDDACSASTTTSSSSVSSGAEFTRRPRGRRGAARAQSRAKRARR